MNSIALRQKIESGYFDNCMGEIYPDTEFQKRRYLAALDAFEEYFGKADVSIFSAPGRTEIAGNHTDHQRGKVLAAAIDLDVIAVALPTSDGVVEIVSESYPRLTFKNERKRIPYRRISRIHNK